MRLFILLVAALTINANIFSAPLKTSTTNFPRQLVASSNQSGNWEIYSVDADTAEVTNLTKNKARNVEPSWSPDGKQIAFVSDKNGKPQLWIMNSDGSNQRVLAQESNDWLDLRWSPKGQHLLVTTKVLVGLAEGPNFTGNIFSVEVATGKITQLTDGKFRSGEPDWSPDGKKIVYTYFINDFQLLTMDANGSNAKEIAVGSKPRWSPDGQKIAFFSFARFPLCYFISTCDPDGKNTKKMETAGSTRGLGMPHWSPDSKQIVFHEQYPLCCQIGFIDESTGNAQTISSEKPQAHPRWSPDGKSISYGEFTNKNGHFREHENAILFVADRNGKNAKKVLEGYGSAEWRPR